MAKYHKKYKFLVEIDGVVKAGFRTCSGLKGIIGVVEENEGGSNITTKELGKFSVDNVTLTNGVTDNTEMYDLFEKYKNGELDDGIGMSVVQLDRAGEEIKRWDCFNCKVITFMAGDWDASAEENTVEETEFIVEDFAPA